MAQNLSFAVPSNILSSASSSSPSPVLATAPLRTATVTPGASSPVAGDITFTIPPTNNYNLIGGAAMTDLASGESADNKPIEDGKAAQAAAASDDEEDDKGTGKGSGKSRRELPAGAVATLKAWLLSPEHFTHPYPTPQDQIVLMQKTGIDKKQLKNWFTNARRRIWKPMLKKQLEQGKITATGAGGGVVAIPGTVPGLMPAPPGVAVAPAAVATAAAAAAATAAPTPGPTTADGSALQYQTLQQTQQGYDAYGNPIYAQQQPQAQTQQQPNVSGTVVSAPQGQFTSPFFMAQQTFGQQQQTATSNSVAGGTPASATTITPGSTITSIPSIGGSPVSAVAAAAVAAAASAPGASSQLSKTDSHAVLMELFARDQDLVRQATESARRKAAIQAGAALSVPDPTAAILQQSIPHIGNQHPMKNAVLNSKGGSVPSLNSWPHFSSVSSLNNLGTMTGVKSITNMSGADLASQGCLNKKGNLAQVKSIESMGRNDSYAFLEVFFDNTNGGVGGHGQRGIKREREEDNDVGLSLDGDDSPSGGGASKPSDAATTSTAPAGAPSPAPLPSDGKDTEGTDVSGTLKRAYDDALAARGLMSVSRSSEKLTDLVLPAKMQRTLSQEIIRQQQMQSSTTSTSPQFTSFNFASLNTQPSSAVPAPQSIINNKATPPNFPGQTATTSASSSSQQYPGQHPSQQQATTATVAGQPNSSQKQLQTPDAAPGSSGLQPHPTTTASPAAPRAPGDGTISSVAPLSDPSMMSSSVEVPATTKCSLCQCINVDTQLRPCGHMFHGTCLKPTLQNAVGPPKCPIDHIPMQSAVLAVPAGQNISNASQQQQNSNSGGSFLPRVSTETSPGTEKV